MTEREWIVCERTGRWSAALRVAIDRADWSTLRQPRLFEVRQVVDLSARLDTRPNGLALVEVQPANLSDVLGWLEEAGRLYPDVRFAALVDRALCGSHEAGAGSWRRDGQRVVDALREAGANEVVMSPRQLQGILALDRHHAASAAGRPDSPPAETSIAAWAWASLPWQDE